jgi:hypothetical protein
MVKHPQALRQQKQQQQGGELLRTVELEAGNLGHEGRAF